MFEEIKSCENVQKEEVFEWRNIDDNDREYQLLSEDEILSVLKRG